MILRILLLIYIITAARSSAKIHCATNQFQCNDGECIPLPKFCDSVEDCFDGSDEIRHLSGFKCRAGPLGDICVLPQHHVTDNTTQCANGNDVCSVRGEDRCHKCLTGNFIVSNTQLCDGIFDCPDLSDECLCDVSATISVCSRLELGQLMTCDNNKTRISIFQVCDGVLDCADFSDERFCRKTKTQRILQCISPVSNKTINAFECDGKIECSDFSDECSRNCTNQPAFCGRLGSFGPSKELLSCNSSNVINGSAGLTRSSLTFTSAEVCNGKWLSCEPRINEEEKGCIGRFYCDNSTSIDSSRVCDGYHDCYSGQDETNCSTLFQCENGSNLSVPLNFLLDGLNDCPGGSDECPKFLDLNPDSSRFEMVKNPGVKIWIWVLGLFGIIGNGSVFVYTARRLLKEISTKGNVVSKSNKFLVLNLNLADGLMSIYFLFLAVKSVEFSGHYCLVDLQWRTGFPCTFMGSVALLAGEASLFTIVAMTSKRLYVVYYPIASRELRVRWLALAMFFVWAISITLAALPFALPSVFVEGYWMRTKLQSEPIVRTRHFNSFIRNVILISEPQNSSHLLQPDLNKVAYLSKYHPRFPILGEFGFYSENTLCVPHFFIPTNDNGWFYPTVIVAVNFLAFVFVSIAYYQIYRKATGTRVRSTASTNKKSMQRRVTKLVVTNFATWLPIFVASFTQLFISKEFAHSIFIATAVVLFPINSLSNPILFSDLFEKIWRFLKRSFNDIFTNVDKTDKSQPTSTTQATRRNERDEISTSDH